MVEIVQETLKGSSSYSKYKKYEQKGKIESSSSVWNSSKYQFTQNTDYSCSKVGASGDYDEQYQYTESNEYRYNGGNNLGGFSQYQYLDDSEFEVIECPIHGRKTVRRNSYYNYY